LLNSVVSIFNAGAAAAAGDYESIATVTVGSGGSSTITFSSIPADYTHLQIRGITRSTRSAIQDTMTLRMNNDTGSNYSNHLLRGDGSSTAAGAASNVTYIEFYQFVGDTRTASVYSGFVMDILDYANTNKYKTMRVLYGYDANGSGDIGIASGLWRNTNAINRLDFQFQTAGANLYQYSHFALYGIKSA
jgi:hypothetical protein